MALLKCRNCAAEIDSEARVTRCKGCGSLFPFECQVCGRNLRPPFPVYSDERYLNGSDEPLCSDHFQRQCPSCKTWFQADENSGYFMCKMCLEVREASVASSPEILTPAALPITSDVSAAPAAQFPDWNQELSPNPGNIGMRDTATGLLFGVVCLSMVAVIGVLIWQVIAFLRLMTGV